MKTKWLLMVALSVVLGGMTGCTTLYPNPPAIQSPDPDRKALYYICPIHPQIKYHNPGDCPICGMKLQPVYEGEIESSTLAPSSADDSSTGQAN